VSSLRRHPPRAPLFPCTTLFRSEAEGPYRRPHLSKALWTGGEVAQALLGTAERGVHVLTGRVATALDAAARRLELDGGEVLEYRSEEHTSELQSRENLVCRLLLE